MGGSTDLFVRRSSRCQWERRHYGGRRVADQSLEPELVAGRANLPDGLDGYLIRRAVECATITYDQLKAGILPDGAKRIRRPLAAVVQPALAG